MNSALDALLQRRPYELTAREKREMFFPAMQAALRHHYAACEPYRRWCDKHRFVPGKPVRTLEEIPFLPAGLFKRMELGSVPRSEVVRVLASSATSSQVPSRVWLDQETRSRQMRVLAAILSDLLGPARRPFVVLDAPPGDTSGSGELPARQAGLRGYLMAASQVHYVLTYTAARPALDSPKLAGVLEQLSAARQPFCLLGYTYILYQYVLKPLAGAGIRIPLPPETCLLHFGGWKKLADQAVSKAQLNEAARNVFGLPPASVRDVYGFTEQLGLIYPDDGDGVKRIPAYAELLVRSPRTLEPVPDGQTGLLEFITPLPHSYPGVALLLDDLGRIVPRPGDPERKYGAGFEVSGRVQHAEVRGCGDTLPAQVYETHAV